MSDFDHAHCETQLSSPLTMARPSPATHRGPTLRTTFRDWMHAWRRRRQFRRLAVRLLNYDDYQLDDIGYSRQDVLAALDQPLKMDSHRLLARWRERRIERATRDPAATARCRPGIGASATDALWSGIDAGIAHPADHGRHDRPRGGTTSGKRSIRVGIG